jgi:nucleoside-diphosphate-sugar epimerase
MKPLYRAKPLDGVWWITGASSGIGRGVALEAARRGCFDHVIIRPSAVYGPLDVEDRVVSKFMLKAMRGEMLRVNGADETLDFTYVDDAADGIVAAAVIPRASNMTFNITKSHSVRLLQAARMIIEIVGKGSIELKDKDADFPSRGSLNIVCARAVLGYDPRVDVAQGFENYYEWFKNSLYWAPKTI